MEPATMSWSQTQQPKDLHDQLTVLIGSAIRLLGGEVGVFVVANEAFDPQSSEEYTLYGLSESVLPILLASVQTGVQPGSARPLVVETVSSPLLELLRLCYGEGADDGVGPQVLAAN